MGSIAGIIFFLIFALIFFVVIVIKVLEIWVAIASLIDVSRKNESEFPNKTIWLIGLILSFFVPFGFVIIIVYYFMYKPNLAFWN